MFFVELDDDGISLADIRKICQYIADEYKTLVDQLTEEELEDLSFMLKPTLEADHNETEIRKRWDKFVKEFVIHDDTDQPMSFFYSSEGHLYFGDKEGMKSAELFSHNAKYPSKKNGHL